MKSIAAWALAGLTCFGFAVTLLGQSQGTRGKFDGTITLPIACAAATAVVLRADVSTLDLMLKQCL